MPVKTSFLPILCLVLFTVTGTAVRAENSATEEKQASRPYPAIRLQREFNEIDLHNIVLMLQPPGNNKDWFVVEKAGRVLQLNKITEEEKPAVFLDITDRVNAQPNEAGLLGMAFDPDYSRNHQVFMSYTGGSESLVSTISRFKAGDDVTTLDPASEQILLQVTQPYTNHNGGNIVFGPDGYLYIGFGDGGAGGDPQKNGQNLQTLLGALLRIDTGKLPYAIPASNPFADGRKGRPEIYAWGLRNPWRWSFDRETGVLWLGDVGQNSWEEVDRVSGPGNFGWNHKEGRHCYKSRHCNRPEFIEPLIEYSHDEGCSITGGFVYRGKAISDLQGVYLYADYCSGTIWGARLMGEHLDQPHQLLKSGLNIASFAQANDGELYVLHYSGKIYRIVPRL